MSRFVLLTAAVLAVAADPKEDPVKAERNKLRGNWKLQAIEVEGRTIVSRDDKHRLLITADDKCILTIEGKQLAQELKIDPGKSPKWFDTTAPGEKPTLGLYELTGDTLRVCEGRPGEARPTEISSVPGKGGLVSTYQRVKP